MSREEKKVRRVEDDAEESPNGTVSQPRRDAVAKLAYATPVVAGLLFSKRSAAMFTPPAPPR